MNASDLLDPDKMREINDRNKRFRVKGKVGVNEDQSFARLNQLGDDKKKSKGFLEEGQYNIIQE